MSHVKPPNSRSGNQQDAGAWPMIEGRQQKLSTAFSNTTTNSAKPIGMRSSLP